MPPCARVPPGLVEWRMAALCLTLLLGACGLFPSYVAQPLDPAEIGRRIAARSLDDPGLMTFIEQHAAGVLTRPIGAWGLDALTIAALYFHPELGRAHAAWEVRRAETVTARQRPNPLLNIPFEHHSDTSSEEPEHWTLGLVFDVLLERRAKREARLAQATALQREARARFLAAAWDVRRAVRAHFLELYAIKQRREQLQRRDALLDEAQQLLERRVALGEASAFELSSARLQHLRTGLELQQLEAETVRSRADLSIALGLVPDALEAVDFDFSALGDLVDTRALDVDELQYQALTGRADVLGALADYAHAEASLRLEMEKQVPDINLSPGYVFDQGDNVWSLGTGLVVPLFHQNQGAIREALARRALAASAFESLQAGIVGRLARAYEYYRLKAAAARSARDLYDEFERRSRDVLRQFQLGYSDRLAVLRAELEVTGAASSVLDAEQGARKAFAELEDVVQRPLDGGIYWELDPEAFTHVSEP